jgi:glutamate/tyrosine decarboxylase-like PLP-dependent enzyme
VRAQDVRLPEAVAQELAGRARALGALAGVDAGGAAALDALTERLRNTYPYGEPEYAGQMLKPPHPVAWAAWATAMALNPNNHALDGGPATAAMEREAVDAIAGMFGMPRWLGHLTSSGTIANLEALWVARELTGGQAVLYSADAHYTHERMCRVLGVPGEVVERDRDGRMSLPALEARLAAGGVGTVVATLGTTGLGALDPVHEIAALCRAHGARLHVDAAYGGFFALIAGGEPAPTGPAPTGPAPTAPAPTGAAPTGAAPTGAAPGVDPSPFAALAWADSIVVDPHKHGLQPYGCGCVLFADPAVGRLYAHDSPYTYFTSPDLHLGEISLECSRAGASAAALWTTLQALPLTREGLGAHVAGARAAALRLAGSLPDDIALVVEPDLDIVCPFPRSGRASEISARCESAFAGLAADGWHVAKLRVDTAWLAERHPGVEVDAPAVTTLRCCLMKPEHVAVADRLAEAMVAHLFRVRAD